MGRFNPQPKSVTIKKKRKPLQRRRKSTGEAEVYKEIIQERGPFSQISGKELYGDLNSWWFSHVLSKGAYPAFRLYKKNIILKTPEEHHLWETQKHKLRELPEWKWVFDLEEELKQEYYARNKNI